MKKFKMVKAGKESLITRTEVIEIIGQEGFDFIKEDFEKHGHSKTSHVIDDIEIFFMAQDI